MTLKERLLSIGPTLCWIGLAAQAGVSVFTTIANYEFVLNGGYSALAPIFFSVLSLPALFTVLLGLLFFPNFKRWPLVAFAALSAPVVLGFLLLKADCGGMC